MQRRFLWRACCALFGLSVSAVAHAASDVWDGNGLNPPNGFWGVGANWVDNTTPGNSDTAAFSLSPFPYSVSFGAAPAAIQALTVSTGAVTFTSSGGEKTLNVTSATGSRDVTITSGAQLHLGTAGNPLNLTAGDDLSIQPGAVVSANYGSVIEANDFSSSGLNGVLSINDSGLTINADSNIGGIAGNGALALNNGGDADFAGSLGVADSATANAYGVLSILNGSRLDLEGNLSVATGNVAGQFGQITIDGGVNSFLTSLVLGSASPWSVTVGSATNGTANINILPAGSLLTGEGPTTINATGTVTLNGGSLHAFGHVIINGGLLEVANSEYFHLATGKTFTIQNGGEANFVGVYDIAGGGTHLVNGPGSTWAVDGWLIVGDSGSSNRGATLLIEAGGSVSSENGEIGTNFSTSVTSHVTVTGIDSNWTVNGELGVGRNGRGSILIEAGGSVSAVIALIGTGSSSLSSKVTIRGSGSIWNISEDVQIGSYLDQSGIVIIETGGLVNIGQELDLVGQQATVTLNGGRINLATLELDGGTFNFNFGTLNFTTSQTISVGGSIEQALGGERRLRFGQHLGIEGTLSLNAPFQIDGGYLEVSDLVPNGNLQFTTGTLGFTGAGGLTIGSGGPLASAVTLAAGQTISVTNTTTVNSDALLVVGSGGSFSSKTINNSGDIVLDGASATLRSTTIFNNSGLLHGRGRVDTFLNNQVAGEVRASVGDMLQFIGSSPNLNNGRINLLGGVIEFTQSTLINNTSGQIVGHGSLMANSIFNDGTIAFSGQANVHGPVTNDDGTIISSGGGPTTFFDDVVNDGEIRTSHGSVSVFFGTVSGSGTFTGTGTVNFEGDLSPGSSPAIVNFGGDVVFGGLSTLSVELGGIIAGSQYDRVVVSGDLTLNGTLDIELISGFNPVAGNSFDILNWSSLNGTFDELLLPDLTAGLAWNTSQLYTTGVLSVALAGDYNGDGTVNAADYVRWRDTMSDNIAGYDVWHANFGATTGSGANQTAVPEPSAFSLAVMGLAVIAAIRRLQCERVA